MATVFRLVAALIFILVAIATFLSLSSNPNRQWFDWVSAGPLIYIFLSLAFFQSDSALVAELDSILAKIHSAAARLGAKASRLRAAFLRLVKRQ